MTRQIGLAAAPLSSHGHQPPIPLPPPVGFSSDVFVNGLPVHRVGDVCIIHPIPGTIPPVPHIPPDVIIEGHATVWANGRPISKFLSSTQHGSQVMIGSRTVLVNSGGLVTYLVSGGTGSNPGVTPPPPAT